MDQYHCIIVCGQTATGKSDLAVKIAFEKNGEVISSDSRQVYKHLNIGSNKITESEMRGVPHHMISIVQPEHRFTVAEYQKRARECMLDIWSRGKIPILCGGTGLYIDATLFPHYVFAGSDAPELPSSMTTEWIGLRSSRESLLPKIQHRITKNQSRVQSEVKHLLDSGISRDWLYHLGLEYRYGIELLEGSLSESEYRDMLATRTWQYARRQMIWFKRNQSIDWRDVS